MTWKCKNKSKTLNIREGVNINIKKMHGNNDKWKCKNKIKIRLKKKTWKKHKLTSFPFKHYKDGGTKEMTKQVEGGSKID